MVILAIELSLKESNSSSGQSTLYPSTNTMNSNVPSKSYNPQSQLAKPKLIVKALYDFLDVEDNELIFYAGELSEFCLFYLNVIEFIVVSL